MRALVKISRLPWKDLALSLREIFFLPLGSPRFNRPKKLWRHRLLGTSNGVYARVYIRLVAALLSGTGFRCGSWKLWKSNERIGRSKTLRTMDGRGPFSLYKLCTYVRSSTSNLSLYIVDCSPVAYFFFFFFFFSLFLEVSRIIDDFQFRIRWGFFEEKCVVLSRQFLSRQREEFSWFILSDRCLNPVQLFSNWLGD